MRVSTVTSTVSFPMGRIRPKEDVPRYHCITCGKQDSEYKCYVFNRRIEPEYNGCYYHSNYSPEIKPFKPPENLEEIIEKEEKLNKS